MAVGALLLGARQAQGAPGGVPSVFVPSAVTLRPAEASDLGALLALINGYAARGLLLRRSEASLRAALGDFAIAARQTADGEEIVGCGALAHLGRGLGEVRSLAVRADAAAQGIGRRIVVRLLQAARARGLVRVLALTRRPSFFAALGFAPTRREWFPEKIRADCGRCPRNLSCDEVAMVAGPFR
jgi:amino-acid N-acetyltransferase